MAVSPPGAVTLQVYWPESPGVQLLISRLNKASLLVIFSLSARASSRALLSFSQVAVTPVPELARASNVAFSPAGNCCHFNSNIHRDLKIIRSGGSSSGKEKLSGPDIFGRESK